MKKGKTDLAMQLLSDEAVKNPAQKSILFYLVTKCFMDEQGKLCKWKGESFEEFCRRFAKLYPFEDTTKVKHHLAETTEGDVKKTESRKRKRWSCIRLLVSMGIPLEAFDVEREVIFPDGAPSLTEFLNISRPNENADFKANYKNFAIKYLNFAETAIKIYDYLGRGDRFVPTLKLKDYFKIHTDIFNHIESKLITPSLNYTRILALHIHGEKLADKVELGKEALRQCSPELFHHLLFCLKEYRGTKHVKFFVTQEPTRTFHFAIFEGQPDIYIYEEHYKLENGDAQPSFVTINKTKFDQNWHFIYDHEMDYIISNPHEISTMYYTYKDNYETKYDIDTLFLEVIADWSNYFSKLKLEQIQKHELRRIIKLKLQMFIDLIVEDNAEKTRLDNICKNI